MPVVARCPCGSNLKVKDALAGKKVKCPKCGEGVLVPAGDEGPSECPSCQEPLAEDAVVCIACGYDLRTGKKVQAAKKKKLICENCGLKIEAGLNRCPYCQADSPEESRRRQRKQKARQEGDIEHAWSRLLLYAGLAPVLGLVFSLIAGFIGRTAPPANRDTAFAACVIGASIAALGAPLTYLRIFGQLIRDKFEQPYKTKWFKRAVFLSSLMLLVTLGIIVGIIYIMIPVE